MKRLIHVLLTALGLCSGCSRSGIMNPSDFTREFGVALGKAAPGVRVSAVKDLELKVTSEDGHESTVFLENAYNEYKLDPSDKDEVIRRFVSAAVDTFAPDDEVDLARIVPVIKDKPWLEETQRAIADRGFEKTLDYVYDDFCAELAVVYAEDSPQKIQYLTAGDLKSAKVERSELRALACENLKRLIPNFEQQGTNGLYMLTAGGTYEASLLLFDSIWSGGKIAVNGDPVVAIPTRGLLLVTGSRYREGIEKLRKVAAKASAEGSYKLTSKLFVYRQGKFEEFVE